NYYKDKLDVEGRFVILTFGLLSRNKGIETILRALPGVVRKHPEVVYVILGATHPEVRKRDGEEYRLWLQRLVRDLKLEEHVIFYDRYVEFDELLELIGACDVYVTPYRSREQIVSGTLAYAVGMGKAVVSTPYPYARELLAEGRGELVEYEDAEGLERTILNLVEKPALLHRMRKSAYEFGRRMVWQEVAALYADVFDRAVAAGTRLAPRPSRKPWTAAYQVPEIKLDHLKRLTDDTGIIQHATYGVPDRRFGYTTDDVARALVVVMAYHRQFGDPEAIELANRYLSFTQYAQRPDGRFHNLMNYARQFVDEQGSEDTQGRALWGLGAVVANAPAEPLRALARDMFERAAAHVAELAHPRAIAYAVCGMYHFLQRYPGAALIRRRLLDLAERLAGIYENSRRADWRWFGEESTYANARMPQAMLLAYEVSRDERHLRIGLEALDFLISMTYRDGHFDFIGNQGWYRRGGERAVQDRTGPDAARSTG
ncbi:MAG: glycosyltransferase, partial [Acidobacteria bacterium]|nr:glycosyltransferase [Acidobacteriota bacterium]